MRKLLYALILAAALMTPERKLDIGKLLPVELVYLGYEEGLVVLKTDTGDVGRGIGITAALENLEDTALGVIYLDTAAHLLVERKAQALLPDLIPQLKKDVGVHLTEGEMDLQLAAEYLSAHKSPVSLEKAEHGMPIPELKDFLEKDEKGG